MSDSTITFSTCRNGHRYDNALLTCPFCGSATCKAILMDGTELEYDKVPKPPSGSKKYIYFTPNKDYVVQFYIDKQDAEDSINHERLKRILKIYNPTVSEAEGGAKGSTKQAAEYFYKLFCWPKALVQTPEFAIVCPAYPSNFFFGSDSVKAGFNLRLKGVDKKSTWFTSPKLRKYLADEEKGDLRKMICISISLSRAVRRLHAAGLAHSDLSGNNVLIDPMSGSCAVIDIDSLVVPGLFPPEVAGTRGYIAPEVLKSLNLNFNDPNRKLPCIRTDLFALPVLIYEYLFKRHPLEGPKIHSPKAEEDDFLAHGPKALFIENPHDTSNRPKNLKTTIHDFGPYLEKLFKKAFVDGLHNPYARPSANDWERALVKTYDLLQPCPNPNCPEGWFVLYDIHRPVCPHCGEIVPGREVMHLRLRQPLAGMNGHWRPVGEVNLYDNMPLFLWHFFANTFPDEKVQNREMQAYISRQNGEWYLVNKNLKGMLSPRGNLVPSGKAVHLKNGEVFLSSNKPNALLLDVLKG